MSTVSRLIAQAIRFLMEGPRVTKRKDTFELVTFGAGGKFSKLNIDKTSLLS